MAENSFVSTDERHSPNRWSFPALTTQVCHTALQNFSVAWIYSNCPLLSAKLDPTSHILHIMFWDVLGGVWQMAAPFESFEAFLAAADVRCSEAQARAPHAFGSSWKHLTRI